MINFKHIPKFREEWLYFRQELKH